MIASFYLNERLQFHLRLNRCA